jgi:peptidyl-prolyl cis-trans isomerase D
VRKQIAEQIATEAAGDRVFDASADDALAITDGVTLETIAEERDLAIQTSTIVHEGDTIDDITPSDAFIAVALALRDVGKTSEAVRVGDDYYILSLVERVASRLPELDEARDRVKSDFQKERAGDLARTKAEEILAELKAGKSVSDFDGKDGLEVAETQAFTRAGGFVGGVGNLPAAKEAAFATKKDGEVLPRAYTLRGDAFVFVRKSFEAATREQFNDVKEAHIEALRRRQEQAAVSEFVRSLKQSMAVSYNQELMAAYVSQ